MVFLINMMFLLILKKSEKDAEIYLSEMINVGLATDEYNIVNLEEYYSLVNQTKKGKIMARKTRKCNEQLPSRKTMELFITKNASKVKSKLHYLEKKGYYKASNTAQYHKSQIRSLNRKYGFREDWIQTGKKFRDTIKSNSDLGIMYKAFKNIININTQKEAKKYKKKIIKSKLLSLLLYEFHFVYTFLKLNST